MNYDTLLQAAKEYWPVIRLEQAFSHNTRKLIRIVVGLLFWVAGIGYLLSAVTVPASTPVGLLVLQDSLQAYTAVLQLLAALSLIAWLILFALDAYYYSYWMKDLPTTLPEHSQKEAGHVSYEVAQILLREPERPTQAFIKSSLGREILLRSGLPYEALNELNSSLDMSGWSLKEPRKINLPTLLRILSEHDEVFMRSIFMHGVQKEHLLGAANWVQKRIHMHKQHRRVWGREHLGRIPGIAKDWSYGYVYYLEKFAQPIEMTSDYASASLESARHKKAAEEIEAILARGRESNALVVGKEGVGKLAVVSRVAKEIAAGNIFPQLEHKHMYVVDGQALVSSGDGKNSFEQMLRLVLDEAARAGNIILVITDLHTVIQSAQNVGSDLVGLLDPHLAGGDIQIIGVTNEQAYFGLLERMPKIAQRFDVVEISSSDLLGTLSIVLDYASVLETKHSIVFHYPALDRLVENTDRYITSGVMPDKAIDILLELTTLMVSKSVHLITEEHVNKFFSMKTNVPIGNISNKERETLLHLESVLHQRIVGQDEAVTAVATTMRRARAGIQNPDRPIGSFLFLGPTGVGKTEVSKSLATAFFGNEGAMIRFDMSEYKTNDALDKLIGSFQTGKPGTLVTALKKQPYGLLLLDEFEKSTDQVKDLFLQILDEGKFSDMHGNPINARNTIIIATSNAGADLIWELFEQGKNPALFKQDLVHEVITRGIYKPELLNRFDGMVVFHPLDAKSLEKIADLMLRKLKQRILENKGIDLSFDDGVVQTVATKGANPQFGARPMNRYIQEHIEQAIADKILREGLTAGSSVTIKEGDI